MVSRHDRDPVTIESFPRIPTPKHRRVASPPALRHSGASARGPQLASGDPELHDGIPKGMQLLGVEPRTQRSGRPFVEAPCPNERRRSGPAEEWTGG